MKSNRLAGLSLMGAIGASLCCIVPIFALLAGIGGAASTFSWIEPAKPYLAGVSLLVISLAWYQNLKGNSEQEDECGCVKEKTSFMQSRTFLLIITFIIVVTLGLPYVSSFFLSNPSQNNVSIENQSNIQKADWKVTGMSCESCELHIHESVQPLPGILICKASYKEASTHVEFDSTKVSLNQITEAINATGYSATLISPTQ